MLKKLFVIAVLSLIACPSPYSRLEPPPGRYFLRAGGDFCETFVLKEDRKIANLGPCAGPGLIETGFFSAPALVCDDGTRFGFAPTLEGFALTRDGQVQAFLFQTRGECERGVPSPPQDTL